MVDKLVLSQEEQPQIRHSTRPLAMSVVVLIVFCQQFSWCGETSTAMQALKRVQSDLTELN